MRRSLQWSPLGFGTVHGHTEDVQRNSDAHSRAAHLGMAASPCLSWKGSWGAPGKASVTSAAVSQCKIPRCLQPHMLSTAAPFSTIPPIPCSGRHAALVCLNILSYYTSFFINFFFQNGKKKNISPFPVPPCHVPKVPTNLRCPACTQPPLIAPAFSSGVSSAIATAAPPPSGNSHLHYHSLLQSRPQAPGSEQQLR